MDDAPPNMTPPSPSASASGDSNAETAYVPPSVDRAATLSGASHTYFTPVPPVLLPPASAPEQAGPPCVLGVDEAGRGPVLGPMVYGVFYLPTELSTPLLKERHRFDDSKVLTPAVREQLMRELCASPELPSPSSSTDTNTNTPEPTLRTHAGFATCSLSAQVISAGMQRAGGSGRAYNLNAQALDATVSLIRGVVERGVNVREIYVDTVGPPATHQARLARAFPAARVVVAKKADSIYPCVSAASVCAKVTRDAALDVLYAGRLAASDSAARKRKRGDAGGEGGGDGDEKDDGEEKKKEEEPGWGSGYPSDACCTAWLRRNMHPLFGWGPECRFSWGTARDMLEGKGGVRVEWPEAGDDDDGEAANARLTDFFGADPADADDELGAWFGAPVGVEAF